MEHKEYLGDSVYASFDGYHVWLTTENGYPDDPRNQIALEPPVLNALHGYVRRLEELRAADALRITREMQEGK